MSHQREGLTMAGRDETPNRRLAKGLPMRVSCSNGEVEVWGTGSRQPPMWPEEEAARMLLSHADILAALEGILPIAEAARHAIGLDIDQRILMDDARAAVAKAKPVDVEALEVLPLED